MRLNTIKRRVGVTKRTGWWWEAESPRMTCSSEPYGRGPHGPVYVMPPANLSAALSEVHDRAYACARCYPVIGRVTRHSMNATTRGDALGVVVLWWICPEGLHAQFIRATLYIGARYMHGNFRGIRAIEHILNDSATDTLQETILPCQK